MLTCGCKKMLLKSDCIYHITEDMLTCGRKKMVSKSGCICHITEDVLTCGCEKMLLKLYCVYHNRGYAHLPQGGGRKIKIRKKEKKRVQTYPNTAWNPIQVLLLHRMQVLSAS
ncbi:hypothetical protein J6590_004298 [Homalodisca vitripennis]|nr:hypothetical protein J6590_004298 [Homalodisca vitripennis]